MSRRLPSASVNLDSSSNVDSYVAAITSDTEALASIAETAPLDSPIVACPGWNLERLSTHTGAVQRWATAALTLGRSPGADEVGGRDPGGGPIGPWLRDGGARLVDALTAGAPDEPTWHPFPAEQRRWVWARRMANETMIHRWDAESAVGTPTPIDPRRAADGLTEYLELGVPRILEREQLPTPGASLHLHCTDDTLDEGDGEWIVWGEDGTYRMEATHRKGDAALRGPAEALLLVMLGRADLRTVDLVGDEAAADAWLALPGW